MMSDEIEYLANYKADQLYTHPGQKGAYATIVGDNETIIGEVEVTERSRLAVSAFYVQDKQNFSTLKLTKLKFHKTYGWQKDGHVQLNHFQVAQMKSFLEIISSLNLTDAKKARLSLENLNVGALGALLGSSKGAELIQELARSPEFHHDIYAVAAKRKVLAEFEQKMSAETSEPEWQAFFEANHWIFGHGLNYVALDKVGKKLETITTGAAFDQAGKRADALVRTRAEVSQYILVEIKRHKTDLLRKGEPYRAGCWGVSDEVSNAVTQIQKTAYHFSQRRFKDTLKDTTGNDTNDTVYAVEPRAYLVVGNMAELQGNDDKVACFELYRRNIKSPEILTFDELLCRAKFIVENISRPLSE
jgi:hypothetical protein